MTDLKRNPAQQLAHGSLIALLCAFMLGCLSRIVLKPIQGDAARAEDLRFASQIILFIVMALYFAAPMLAILALFKMRQYGREGVLVRAVVALILSGIVIGSMTVILFSMRH